MMRMGAAAFLLFFAGRGEAASLLDSLQRDDPPMRFKAVMGPYQGYTEMYRAYGTPWGPGTALTALWSYSVGVGAELQACAALGREVLVAAVHEGEPKQVLHRLDGDGKETAKAKTGGDVAFTDSKGRNPTGFVFKGKRELLIGGAVAGRPALVLKGSDELNLIPTLSVVDLDGKEAMKVGESVSRPLWADLDGDGERELVAAGLRRDGGSLHAYGVEGKLWERKGLDDIAALAAGRLGPGKEESILAFTDPPEGTGTVAAVVDGKGASAGESKDDFEVEKAVYLRPEGGGGLVAEVSRLGADKPRLRIRLWKGATPSPVAEADLGWTEIEALAAADLDGDGRKEVFVATSTGWVLVYDEKGTLLAERSYRQKLALLASADLKGGGREQVLVGIGGKTPWVHAVGLMAIPEGKQVRNAP